MNDDILYIENSNCTNYNLNKSYQNNISQNFIRKHCRVGQQIFSYTIWAILYGPYLASSELKFEFIKGPF